MKKLQLFVFYIGLVLVAFGCSQPPMEELTQAQQAVGEAAGLIDDIRPAAQIIGDMVRQAELKEMEEWLDEKKMSV